MIRHKILRTWRNLSCQRRGLENARLRGRPQDGYICIRMAKCKKACGPGSFEWLVTNRSHLSTWFCCNPL